MTKPTWKVSTGTHELLGDTLCVSTQEGDVDVICIVSAGERTTEADLGNARLISAAPDLLEALKETLDEGIGWFEESRGPYIDGLPWVTKARAAIAKATGEQE